MAILVPVYSENNDYQKLEVLKRNRNKRHKYKQFFVEGVRNLNVAVQNGWPIVAFVFNANQELSQWGRQLLDNVPAVYHYALHGELMAKLSDKEQSSELIAVITMPEDDLMRIKVNEQPLVVLFDRPSSRGNLGTIIRSCDALGAQGLIVTGHAVDVYDPETIRSSMGSFFNVPIVRIPSPDEVEQWIDCMKANYADLQIIGTSAKANKEIHQADFSKPTVLLIGNETDGLSHKYVQISDSTIRIPIAGSASSLNVACATSILLYEIQRQRTLGY